MKTVRITPASANFSIRPFDKLRRSWPASWQYGWLLLAVCVACQAPQPELPPEPTGPALLNVNSLAHSEAVFVEWSGWQAPMVEVPADSTSVQESTIAPENMPQGEPGSAEGEVPVVLVPLIPTIELAGEHWLDGQWQVLDLVDVTEASETSRLVRELEPGRYRFQVSLTDSVGELLGHGMGPEVDIAEPKKPLRFLSSSQDLGLSEALDMRLLVSFAWMADSAWEDNKGEPSEQDGDLTDEQIQRQLLHDAEQFSSNALSMAVGPTYLADLESLRAVENARDLLLTSHEQEGAADMPPTLPHNLGAQALVIVDVQTHGPSLENVTLGMRLFDMSYRRYFHEQPERRLWNRRLLVFEDHVRLSTEQLVAGETLEALVAGWKELLVKLSNDAFTSRYREFLSRHDDGSIWNAAEQRALLELLGLESSGNSAEGSFDQVEADLFFPTSESRWIANPVAVPEEEPTQVQDASAIQDSLDSESVEAAAPGDGTVPLEKANNSGDGR